MSGTDHLKEREYIDSLRTEYPQLFVEPTLVEDARFLKGFGIYIPQKKSFSKGYIKLYPEDFIVEEIAKDGTVYTVTHDNVLNQSSFIPTSPILYATLVKCNISTVEAIKDLSTQLHCDKSQIGYAGLKDEKAFTAQRISLKNVSIEHLKKVSSPHYFLKDTVPGTNPIQKGVISGNRFSIFVRTEKDGGSVDKDTFQKSLDNLKQTGFYNYYYLQRFGPPRLLNFQAGMDLLRGNYEQVVKDVITKTGPQESLFYIRIRTELLARWGNWQEMLNIISPVASCFLDEQRLLQSLLKDGTNFKKALHQIPETVALLVYSVSSLFFNKYIAEQIQSQRVLLKELPLLLSNDQQDIDLYKTLLESIKMYPLSFQNVLPFTIIRLQKRMVATMSTAKIHSYTICPEGVALSFSLDTGQYATTFLAHLFNLVSGNTPDNFYDTKVNVKERLREGTLSPLFEHFKKVL
jgi:TruD family tRNA pseudouridine synthase